MTQPTSCCTPVPPAHVSVVERERMQSRLVQAGSSDTRGGAHPRPNTKLSRALPPLSFVRGNGSNSHAKVRREGDKLSARP